MSFLFNAWVSGYPSGNGVAGGLLCLKFFSRLKKGATHFRANSGAFAIFFVAPFLKPEMTLISMVAGSLSHADRRKLSGKAKRWRPF